MSVSINGTSGIVFNDASSQNTAATGFGFKNRIINGGMVIDQRNAGASVTPATGAYTLDRWQFISTQASKFTVQQTPSATETGYANRVGAGFTNYLAMTVSSSVSIGSSDYINIRQKIEGLNVPDLAWGTSNAKTVTLSFWAYSSLTGTFGGYVENSAGDRSYPFSYTISSANTWEQKTITIVGDQSGTWLTTNGIGILIGFSLGAGSTYSGTAGSWGSTRYFSATGATSVVGTNGATFYITGVQLEKGSTATSFDYRPYSTELQLCQRYLPAISSTSTADYFDYGQSNNATNAYGHFNFLVTPRVPPTGLVVSNPAHITAVNPAGVTMVGTSATFSIASLKYARWTLIGSGGLTAGQIAEIYFNNASGYLYFTGCEL